jgi:rsbT co-antagonist protein RsbR
LDNTEQDTGFVVTPHRLITGLLLLIIVTSVVMLIISGITGSTLGLVSAAVSSVLFFGLLTAHRRGWRYSAHALVLAAIVLTITGNPEELTLRQISFTVLIPAVLAALLLPWYWAIGAFIICVIGIGAQSGFQGPLFQPDVLVLATLIGIGAGFAGAFGRSAQRVAERNARRAEEALAHAEAQARELVDANELMGEQLDQQSKLLELVNTLETPVVPLAAGMLLAPIVGHVDTRRAQALTTRLLHEASSQRAKLVVLDIAGVSVMDTSVAKALVHTVHALRLLGCEVALSGISASVAMSLIHLGVNLDEVRTVRSPQEALANYLGSATPSAQRGEIPRLKSITTPLNTNGNEQVSHN